MLQDKRTERKVIVMEPIIYTLSHVKTGVIRHVDDDIRKVTVDLYTDGSLWTVVIEEGNPMDVDQVTSYRATDEIQGKAIMNACIRANNGNRDRSFTVNQIYEALDV